MPRYSIRETATIGGIASAAAHTRALASVEFMREVSSRARPESRRSTPDVTGRSWRRLGVLRAGPRRAVAVDEEHRRAVRRRLDQDRCEHEPYASNHLRRSAETITTAPTIAGMTNPPDISERPARGNRGRASGGRPSIARRASNGLETVDRNDPLGERGAPRRSSSSRERGRTTGARPRRSQLDARAAASRRSTRDARRTRFEGRDGTRARIRLHLWLQSRDTSF